MNKEKNIDPSIIKTARELKELGIIDYDIDKPTPEPEVEEEFEIHHFLDRKTEQSLQRSCFYASSDDEVIGIVKAMLGESNCITPGTYQKITFYMSSGKKKAELTRFLSGRIVERYSVKRGSDGVSLAQRAGISSEDSSFLMFVAICAIVFCFWLIMG